MVNNPYGKPAKNETAQQARTRRQKFYTTQREQAERVSESAPKGNIFTGYSRTPQQDAATKELGNIYRKVGGEKGESLKAAHNKRVSENIAPEARKVKNYLSGLDTAQSIAQGVAYTAGASKLGGLGKLGGRMARGARAGKGMTALNEGRPGETTVVRGPTRGMKNVTPRTPRTAKGNYGDQKSGPTIRQGGGGPKKLTANKALGRGRFTRREIADAQTKLAAKGMKNESPMQMGGKKALSSQNKPIYRRGSAPAKGEGGKALRVKKGRKRASS